MALSAPAGGVAANYVRIVHQVPFNTPAPGFIRQVWNQRTLNQITDDDQGLASLAANVITLQPGTYRTMCYVPLRNTSYHQARLRDTTNALQYLGCLASNSVGSTEASIVTGRFTLAAPANFVLESFSWVNGNEQVSGASNPDDELWIVCEFFEVP